MWQELAMQKSKSLWDTIKSYFKAHRFYDPQFLIDSSSDIIILIKDNRIEGFNRVASQEFGFSQEEILGLPIDVIFEESSIEKLSLNELRAIGEDRPLKAIRKNGTVFSVHLILSEFTFDETIFYVGFVHHNLNEKNSRERQEDEDNAKADYISILSHELRTPIAAIQGALGILAHSKDFSEKHLELLKIAYRNTERLGKIVNLLLDLDMLKDSKHIVLADTVLIPLLKESIALSRSSAEKKNVIIIENYPANEVRVLSDYDKLMHVCLNLLSNAIKSSPSGEKILVSLEVFSDKVRVSIEDRGDGIPENFRPKLFNSFTQAIHGDKKQEGLGLGLHLSQKIIDLFGGTIGFVPGKEKGTIFYFELPVSGKRNE